jgi:site-specific recombinase XerD
MRHTAATRLLSKSGNLKHVQTLLGHTDIKTTARFYAHVTVEDLRRALDAESPMTSPISEGSETRKAQ